MATQTLNTSYMRPRSRSNVGRLLCMGLFFKKFHDLAEGFFRDEVASQERNEPNSTREAQWGSVARRHRVHRRERRRPGRAAAQAPETQKAQIISPSRVEPLSRLAKDRAVLGHAGRSVVLQISDTLFGRRLARIGLEYCRSPIRTNFLDDGSRRARMDWLVGLLDHRPDIGAVSRANVRNLK